MKEKKPLIMGDFFYQYQNEKGLAVSTASPQNSMVELNRIELSTS
jgi:hypothetical protein